ncbi:MAG: SRPBCC family protein [Myxococcales bacterium]|nr:SRPBCC family protein [Myxococcales bacterium]
MLKKILIVLAVLIVGFVALVATRPDVTTVERSVVVDAPPTVVFDYVNDFRQWAAWSPWDALDPEQKKTFEGPETGKGAITTWSGNDKVGKGKMTILESKPGAFVRIELEFIEPWASKNETTFTLTPEGDGTKVVWSSTFENNFMSKAFGLFVDMDSMIGGDFEKGLASLKAAAEKSKVAAPMAAPAAAPDAGMADPADAAAPAGDAGAAPAADAG